MPLLSYSDGVDIQAVYDGSLFVMAPCAESQALCAWAAEIVQDKFGTPIQAILSPQADGLQDFISRAKATKTCFTNDAKTKALMSALVRRRYAAHGSIELLYDLPRLRIVPTSAVLSSGISYNYKPHRDTWYGAGQDQLNHWMAVANVTPEATFYIAPAYFRKPVSNSSRSFDLDEWDTKYRPVAEQSVTSEQRPHPVPLEALPEEDRYRVVLPPAGEVAFAGHHLHGSSVNVTERVRFSIDYRVCPTAQTFRLPENIDSGATGDVRKFMLAV